jgi:hypothetical protein
MGGGHALAFKQPTMENGLARGRNPIRTRSALSLSHTCTHLLLLLLLLLLRLLRLRAVQVEAYVLCHVVHIERKVRLVQLGLAEGRQPGGANRVSLEGLQPRESVARSRSKTCTCERAHGFCAAMGEQSTAEMPSLDEVPFEVIRAAYGEVADLDQLLGVPRLHLTLHGGLVDVQHLAQHGHRHGVLLRAQPHVPRDDAQRAVPHVRRCEIVPLPVLIPKQYLVWDVIKPVSTSSAFLTHR